MSAGPSGHSNRRNGQPSSELESAVGQPLWSLDARHLAVKTEAARHNLDTSAPRRARLAAATRGLSSPPSSFTSFLTGVPSNGGSRHEFPLDPSGSKPVAPGAPRPGAAFVCEFFRTFRPAVKSPPLPCGAQQQGMRPAGRDGTLARSFCHISKWRVRR